jgi:hypothetical protein
MPKYIVETLNTFVQCHIVEAENELDAKFIAGHADSNGEKWLGQQIFDIQEYNQERIQRWKEIDGEQFFTGIIKLDDEGYIAYIREDGTVLGKEFIGE